MSIYPLIHSFGIQEISVKSNQLAGNVNIISSEIKQSPW